MFDHTQYVPILKGKEGEYSALRELTGSVKDLLTPLAEIPSIPYDFENDAPAKTVDEHLRQVTLSTAKCDSSITWLRVEICRKLTVSGTLLFFKKAQSPGR
jgi:hypothetical protein